MKSSEILFTSSKSDTYIKLNECINSYSKWILVLDESTNEFCKSEFLKNLITSPHSEYIFKLGEKGKNLSQIESLCAFMMQKGLDRKSLVVNLGGGVVCDMGGFAASIFKRGIDFVNVPTTLLAMVDASVGGKTGVNLNEVKNQIGSFQEAEIVLIDELYLKTLPAKELLSGYAEMIKHALIADSNLWKMLMSIDNLDRVGVWTDLIQTSVKIKSRITKDDIFEKGDRKKLNFGHSVGHALESLLNRKNQNISHGHAVAEGIIIECYISLKRGNFKESQYNELFKYLRRFYEKLTIQSDDVLDLIELMSVDKKNENHEFLFVLINEAGSVSIDQNVSKNEISEALEYYIIKS